MDRVSAQVRILVALIAVAAACGAEQDTASGGPGLHALGQEPGWMVDLEPGGDLRVVARYGADTIIVVAPEPTTDSTGARVYRASSADHDVAVTVEDEPCRGAMSGKPFPMTVTLELDGEPFRGCGEPPGPTAGG